MLRTITIAAGLALALAISVAYGGDDDNAGSGNTDQREREGATESEADDEPSEQDGDAETPLRPDVDGFRWLREESFRAGDQRHTVQIYRHEAFANALGLEEEETDIAAEFVLIPAGTCAHGLDVAGFLLARTPVTQQVWRGLVGETGLPLQPLRFRGERRPMHSVSNANARAWCEANGLRLPSEKEWAYACRAGTTTRYYFGDSEEQLADHAWYLENAQQRPHNIGAKLPNAFGLHDMLGNVWEWTSSNPTEYFSRIERNRKGPHEIQCNPGDPRNPPAAPLSTRRVVRGGSWSTPANRCQSTSSTWHVPGYQSDTVGFRPARSLPEEFEREQEANGAPQSAPDAEAEDAE